MADRDPEHLHPQVRALMDKHQALGASHAVATTLIETYRDETDQLAAWEKGRDAAGNVVDATAIVTYSRPGQSYHGVRYKNGTPCAFAYHLAVDIAGPPLLGFGDSRMDSWAEKVYTVLGEMGESLGLTWGGRWTLRDWTHFEYRIPGKSLADIQSMILTLGDIDSLFVRT